MKLKISIFLLMATFFSACVSEDVLTKKEMLVQNKADAVVANVLFDNDFNERASYNVKKDGSVVIKFDEKVSEKDYTKIVNLLRSNSSVDGVYAEQMGREVCGMR